MSGKHLLTLPFAFVIASLLSSCGGGGGYGGNTGGTSGNPRVRVTDDFNRANVDPIGAPWATAGVNGGQIANDELAGGGAGDDFVIYTGDNPPADQYSKITFVASSNAGADNDDGGPMVRCSTSVGPRMNGYLFNVASNDQPGPDSDWIIFKVVDNVGTALSSGTLSTSPLGRRTLQNGDVLEIRIQGQNITALINGIQIGTAMDATFAGGQYGAHLFEGAGVGGLWDNFEGGDFSG